MVTKNREFYFTTRQFSNNRNYVDGVLVGESSTKPFVAWPKLSSRTGINNPKWRSLIKSGGSATSPMSGFDVRQLEDKPFTSVFTSSYKLGDHQYYSEGWNNGNSSIGCQTPGHVGGTSLTVAENQASSRTLANVRAEHTKFQGIVSLGELSETLRLLRHPFKGVDKWVSGYLRDLKSSKSFKQLAVKRTKSSRKSFLTMASDLWLEVAFGVRPLLNDVADLTGALLHNSYGVSRTMVVGTGNSTTASDGTQIEGSVAGGILRASWQNRTTRMIRYKAALDSSSSVHEKGISRLQDALGFNLESFVPSVYNLIPFSFLVDYFSNLGDVIEAGTTNQQAVKWVLRTDRLETVRTGVLAPVQTNFGDVNTVVSFSSEGGSFVTVNRTVDRSSVSSVPLPDFQVNLPGSPMKYANMLALLKSNEDNLLKRIRF